MNKPIRILIACGSGVATSTVAKSETEKVCKTHGFNNVEVQTTDVRSMKTQAPAFDIICSTVPYRRNDVGKPIVNLTSFITGMNKKKAEAELVNAIEEFIKQTDPKQNEEDI